MSLFRLLLVGVESNPGPIRHLTAVKNVTIGTLNSRSAVLNTADLHLTIHDEALDIFAVQETRVPQNAPDVIGKDLEIRQHWQSLR